jgi:SAM-dependent methyltransferase
MSDPIRFDDGASYERMMGVWSRLVGQVFLDWLKPGNAQSWIDVGCGNGAFTELLIQRTAPSEVHAVDPSPAQIAYARERAGARMAEFKIGDAMDLPFAADSFDAAVMALVIFFVPEPIKGVSEMVRTVRPGGSVSAYAWDLPAGGLPLEPIRREMIAIGLNPPLPPHPEVSSINGLSQLWTDAGLQAVETRTITVERTFADFNDLWETLTLGPGIAPTIAALPSADVETMKEGLRRRMTANAQGQITYSGVANAVKGRKPA